jgi:hypothetical protein
MWIIPDLKIQHKNPKFNQMGLVAFDAIFEELPSANLLETKLKEYSGLDISLKTCPSKFKEITRYEIILNENTAYRFDGPVITFLEPYALYDGKYKNDKNTIDLTGPCVDRVYDTTLENYFFFVLSAILADMGGMDNEGRKLSDTWAFKLWQREKWQGEAWFKSNHKEPTLWDDFSRLFKKKQKKNIAFY